MAYHLVMWLLLVCPHPPPLKKKKQKNPPSFPIYRKSQKERMVTLAGVASMG